LCAEVCAVTYARVSVLKNCISRIFNKTHLFPLNSWQYCSPLFRHKLRQKIKKLKLSVFIYAGYNRTEQKQELHGNHIYIRTHGIREKRRKNKRDKGNKRKQIQIKQNEKQRSDQRIGCARNSNSMPHQRTAHPLFKLFFFKRTLLDLFIV
jgi:hypothetical protein